MTAIYNTENRGDPLVGWHWVKVLFVYIVLDFQVFVISES